MNVTRSIHPVLVRQLVATQEVSDSHTLLSGELKGPQVQIAAFDRYLKVGLSVRVDTSCRQGMGGRNLGSLIDFQHQPLAVGLFQFGPGSGIGRQSAHEVINGFE